MKFKHMFKRYILELERSLIINLVVTNDYNFTHIFLLDVNFDKSTIELNFLLVCLMLEKFSKDQRSITISLIKCLNFKFL